MVMIVKKFHFFFVVSLYCLHVSSYCENTVDSFFFILFTKVFFFFFLYALAGTITINEVKFLPDYFLLVKVCAAFIGNVPVNEMEAGLKALLLQCNSKAGSDGPIKNIPHLGKSNIIC